MPEGQIPEAEFSSRVYIRRGQPLLTDSQRFRARLFAYLQKRIWLHLHYFATDIHTELRISIPYIGGDLAFEQFLSTANLHDLFDVITLATCFLQRTFKATDADAWVEFVGRVFREENLGYRVDPKGGVHYKVDDEYDR